MRETFPLGKMRDGALDYSIGCQILALAFILLSTQVIVGTQAGNPDAHDRTAAQTSGGASTDGIQKRSNEFGIWGGISFDAPTLIGKTPDAKFGNIGLRYGRVLLASQDSRIRVDAQTAMDSHGFNFDSKLSILPHMRI